MADETSEALPYHRLPLATGEAAHDLLRGVRVLDLTTSIAGPYATQLLGDMGAEVVKVERPRLGDDARHWGPPFLDGRSLWFLSVNRNKKSLTLDYGAAEGRALLHRLVPVFDVVVVNRVERAQRKLGCDYASLSALHPPLIFVALTGFGQHGARRDRACYDLIAEGYSGVMDMTGEAGGAAQKIGTPAADLLAGMDAAFAVACALVERASSGRGRKIDVAMVNSMTRFMGPRLMAYLGSGELLRRSGGRDSVIAIYQTFETADQPITLGLGNDAIWRRFWTAVGEPAFGEREDYDSNARRRQAREDLVARIQARLATQPRDHWLEVFAKAGVPAGPINRLDQVAADEELVAEGLFYRVEHHGGSSPQVGLGIRVDDALACPAMPPPDLGAHSRELLQGLLGLDAAAIDALAAKGII